MAVDQISNKGLVGQQLNSDPGNGAVAVTKSDTLDVFGQTVSVNSRCARALYVGGTGDINATLADGTKVVFVGVQGGTILPVRVRQVWSTSTGATDIVALY